MISCSNRWRRAWRLQTRTIVVAQNEVTVIGRINYSAATMSSHSSQSGPTLDWQPLRGPFSRWPRTADTVLALVSLSLTVSMWYSDTVMAEVSPGAKFAAMVMFLIGNLALIWRRSAPFVVHGVAVLISAIAIAANFAGGPIFALSISLYSLGCYEPKDKRSFLGAGAAVALLAVEGLLLSAPGSRDFTSLVLALLIWYVGRRIRFRGNYLRLLEERALQLEHQQSAEATGTQRTAAPAGCVTSRWRHRCQASSAGCEGPAASRCGTLQRRTGRVRRHRVGPPFAACQSRSVGLPHRPGGADQRNETCGSGCNRQGLGFVRRATNSGRGRKQPRCCCYPAGIRPRYCRHA